MSNEIGLSETQTALTVVFLLISPLACGGLALINTGLGRSRNAAHAMIAALCAIAVASCVYFVCGHSWQGAPGEVGHSIMLKGKSWGWIGAAPAFFAGLPADGSPSFLVAWMGLISVALAAMIPLGSGAERWKLGSICASTAIFSGVTFPLFAHWTWGGGWLAQLGFIDAGGAGSIHAVGGLTALAIVWLLGSRRGKYGSEGMPMAIPGHSIVFVLFGCIIAAAGWLGLNSAGAILYQGVPPGRIALIAVNTILAACAAALVGAVITRVRFGMPDASLTANGWVGGLVAASAGCASMPPAAAVLVGLVAGALVTFSVEMLELRLDVDDPGGSISVHGVAGIWGVLAVGLFGRIPAGQWLAQVVGIATLIGFVLPVSWGLNWVLNRVAPLRVSREGERQGMDLFELGAGAYPDFITHTDEFMQR